MADKIEKTEKKSRVPMPEQDPKVRARNFLEVPTGYTMKMAQEEAARCLQCKKPGCRTGCPVGVDIPAFIDLIAQGDMTAAIRSLWSQNALPAVCGRVLSRRASTKPRLETWDSTARHSPSRPLNSSTSSPASRRITERR